MLHSTNFYDLPSAANMKTYCFKKCGYTLHILSVDYLSIFVLKGLHILCILVHGAKAHTH